MYRRAPLTSVGTLTVILRSCCCPLALVAASALAAKPAFAVDECGPVSGNSLNCVPGIYASGIVFDAGIPATPAAPFTLNVGGAGPTFIGGVVGYEAGLYSAGSVINLNGPLTLDGASTVFARDPANHTGPLRFNINGDVTLQNGGSVLASATPSDVLLDISGNVTALAAPAHNAFSVDNANVVTINATGNLSFKTQLDIVSGQLVPVARTGFRLIDVGEVNFTSSGAFNTDATSSGGYGLFAGGVARDVNLNIANIGLINGALFGGAAVGVQNVGGAFRLTSTGTLKASNETIVVYNAASADINVHDLSSNFGHALQIGNFNHIGVRTGGVNFRSTGRVDGAVEINQIQHGNVAIDLNRGNVSLNVLNVSDGSVKADFNDVSLSNSTIANVSAGNVTLDGALLTLGTPSSSSALRINDIHGNVTIGGGEQPSVTLSGVVNSGGQANAGFDINHVTGNVSLNLNSVASSSDSYLYLARIQDIGGATNVAVAGNVVDTAEGGFLVRRSTGPVTLSLHDYATHNTTGLFGPVFTAVEIEDTASGDVTVSASNMSIQGGGGMTVFNTAAGSVSLTAQDITSDETSLATVNTRGSVTFVARDLTSSGSPGIVVVDTLAGNVTATVRDVSGDNGGIAIRNTTAGNVVITARDVRERSYFPAAPDNFRGDAIVIEGTSGTSLLNLSGNVFGMDGGIDISGQHGNAIINLGATGSIGGLNGPAISLLADAGTVNQINALGDIFGGIVAGDGNDTFISDNTWLVGLGGGVASFSLGGGANRIVNNGTLGTGDLTATVGGAAFAGGDTLSDVTLANARFENNGTVTMSNALFAGGATFNGDHLTINGDFAAGAASTLVLDAALGGPGSAADLLTINGNLTGVTRLVINNALPGGGAANLGGIPLVNVFGAADKSNMVLDGGPITSGLFVYDLDFTTGTAPAATGAAVAALAAATPASFFLTSAGTSAIAATLPDLLAPAVSVMSASFDAWIDREGDMRQILARGEGAADGANGLGIWFKGFASERDIAQGAVAAIGASGFSYDRSHKQTLGGFLGGIDLAHADGPGGGTMIFGIMGGYASANVAFGLSGASATFEGPLAGAYASYLNGPFYIDAAIQADFLKMSASLGSAGNLSDVSATSLGVRAETGYRFDVGGMFIDPSLALTYSTSHLNDVSLPGANIDFATGKSLAVRAALRVGKTFALDGGTHVTPSATLGISQEMLGGLASTLSSGGNSFALNSALPGTIFDAGLGLDVVHGNFSAFARANATIGKDVKGFGGKLGVSLRF